ELDCYKVLALPSFKPGIPTVSQEEIKKAYRRALLKHHPDKNRTPGLLQRTITRYTIDEITYAYNTLSNNARRLEHDSRLSPKSSAKDDKDYRNTHIGIDTLDLDELHYDWDKSEWHRGCRCGATRGFTVNEDDLQQSYECGELVTECLGCSLRLRLTFAVADD
ncbi:MAG: hypothetical protein L6R39_007844, partial [Caloplaca ligustica]